MDFTTAGWFGELLGERRKICGLTQAEAARHLHIKKTTVNYMEQTGIVKPDLIERLSELYDLPRPVILLTNQLYKKQKGLAKRRILSFYASENRTRNDN